MNFMICLEVMASILEVSKIRVDDLNAGISLQLLNTLEKRKYNKRQMTEKKIEIIF